MNAFERLSRWASDRLPILRRKNSNSASSGSHNEHVGDASIGYEDKDTLIAFDYALSQEEREESTDWESPGSMDSFKHESDALISEVDAFLKGLDERDAEDKEEDTATRVYMDTDIEYEMEEILSMPFEVTFYFPSKFRPNRVGKGTYGAKNMTYRNLYELLVTQFNGGVSFIDTYFNTVFKERMLPKYREAVAELKADMLYEASVLKKKRRFSFGRSKEDSSALVKPRLASKMSELSRQTKRDIVTCLRSGRIPLAKTWLSPSTIEKRDKLGISSREIFFATGRLIESIVVAVVLLDNDTYAKISRGRVPDE